MRSGHAAEGLLALFTSPDRALSVVGDLSEQACSRGSIWFWFQIVRTTAAFFWQELCDAPLRIAFVVAAGWLAHQAIALYVAFPFAQLLGWTPPIYYTVHQRAAWLVGMLLFGLILVPFLLGLLMARFSGGRSVTVCLAFALIGQNLLTCYFFYLYWICMGDATAAEKISRLLSLQLRGHAFVNSVVGASVLAAGYLYRRRTLQTHAIEPR